MSATELTQWMAYAAIEPFGERRADLRIAQLCALIANVNRDRKRRPKPFSIEDFLLFREPVEREVRHDAKGLRAALSALNAGFKRKGK